MFLAIFILAAISPDPSSNLVIKSGGNFSGHYSHVQIATTEPISFDGATFSNSDRLNIDANIPGAQLTIRHCSFTGGQVLDALQPAFIDFENNTIESVTNGININDARGAVNIVYNDFHNINAPASNDSAHAILIQHTHLSAIAIDHNRIVNEPGKSFVNDLINIYESSGTQRRPIRIEDNLLRGLYAVDPKIQYNSGCGIIVDGSNDPAIAAAFVEIDHNAVIATGNAGIAIAAGHDNSIHDNRVIASGLLDDGSAIFAQNVGIYIHPMNLDPNHNFQNDTANGNRVGWLRPPHTYQNKTDKLTRADWWMPETNRNVSWPGQINRQSENDEADTWEKKNKPGVTNGDPRL